VCLIDKEWTKTFYFILLNNLILPLINNVNIGDTNIYCYWYKLLRNNQSGNLLKMINFELTQLRENKLVKMLNV